MCLSGPGRVATFVSPARSVRPGNAMVGVCHRSSVVEHTLGKGEVKGSSPFGGFLCPTLKPSAARKGFERLSDRPVAPGLRRWSGSRAAGVVRVFRA